MAQSDQLLVRRMLSGDRRAFDEFFDSYVPRLHRFALRRVGNKHDVAEDVVQAVLVKAIEKLETFRGTATLLTWLCTICRHEIANWGRGVARNGRLEALDEHANSPNGDGAGNPEEILLREENVRLARAILGSLPPHYGEVLEWKYIEEISVKEIAQRLGGSVKAAESTLTRARQEFREALEAAKSEGKQSEETPV